MIHQVLVIGAGQECGFFGPSESDFADAGQAPADAEDRRSVHDAGFGSPDKGARKHLFEGEQFLFRVVEIVRRVRDDFPAVGLEEQNLFAGKEFRLLFYVIFPFQQTYADQNWNMRVRIFI